MRGFRARIAGVAIALLVTAGIAGAAHAAPGQSEQSPQVQQLQQRVARLEATVAALRRDYDARLATIEAQLAELAAATAPGASAAAPGASATASAAPPTGGDEVAAADTMSAEERTELERELAAILGEGQAAGGAGLGAGGEGAGAGQGTAPSSGQRFAGQARTLNQLNPEISATGDMFGTFSDHTGDPDANQFRFGEFEVALQAPLDPYSAAKFIIVQEDGEVSLEEGYMEYNSLPGGVGMKAGQMRLDWGKLNRWHQHGLPQSDRPLAHQAMLGEEGLAGLGASVSWLAPTFLGDYNEVIFQVVNDDNDVAFSGRGFDQPVYLVHETNYFDLSPASYFELGFSATTGSADLAGDFRNQVYGTDWNFDWSPPASALYEGFELRGELLWERRDGPGGLTTSLGTYTYGVYQLSQRSFAGLRGDWTELPAEPGASMWGVSPFFEWWQSEFARFRFQYSYSSRQLEFPEPEHKFYIQLTWAIGPHKHEKY